MEHLNREKVRPREKQPLKSHIREMGHHFLINGKGALIDSDPERLKADLQDARVALSTYTCDKATAIKCYTHLKAVAELLLETKNIEEEDAARQVARMSLSQHLGMDMRMLLPYLALHQPENKLTAFHELVALAVQCDLIKEFNVQQAVGIRHALKVLGHLPLETPSVKPVINPLAD